MVTCNKCHGNTCVFHNVDCATIDIECINCKEVISIPKEAIKQMIDGREIDLEFSSVYRRLHRLRELQEEAKDLEQEIGIKRKRGRPRKERN